MGGPILGISTASNVVARWKFMGNEVIADREIEDPFLGFTGRKDPFRWVKSEVPIADSSGRPTYIDSERARTRTIVFGKNRRIVGRNRIPVRRPVTNDDGHRKKTAIVGRVWIPGLNVHTDLNRLSRHLKWETLTAVGKASREFLWCCRRYLTEDTLPTPLA